MYQHVSTTNLYNEIYFQGKEQNGEKEENSVLLPVSIICGLVFLGVLIGVIVYQVKHKDIG